MAIDYDDYALVEGFVIMVRSIFSKIKICLYTFRSVGSRPGFAPPRGAESQNLHRTLRGAGADFRTSTNPEGREGRWRVTLIDPHKPAFA